MKAEIYDKVSLRFKVLVAASIGILATVYYFVFLLVLLPAIGYIESKLASIKSYTPKFGPKEIIMDE